MLVGVGNITSTNEIRIKSPRVLTWETWDFIWPVSACSQDYLVKIANNNFGIYWAQRIL